MQDVIGRKKEIELMLSLKKSKKSKFLAVYGRRRVGKTFLIRQVFAEDFAFQLTGLANTKLQWQLANFHRAFMRQHPQNLPIAPTKNWFDAFQQFSNIKMRRSSACKSYNCTWRWAVFRFIWKW